MIPLLIGISFLVYAMVNLVPGSPLDRFESQPNVRAQDLDRIRHSLGLDRPWYLSYFTWLGHALRGDLGFSFTNYSPVTDLLKATVPNTLLLTVSALIFALILAIPIGVLAAVKRGSWFDNVTTVIATAFHSVPSLWLGLMFIILFGVYFQKWDLPAFPTAGEKTLRGEGGGFLDRAHHLILPMLTLELVELASYTRYIRSEMLEVIRLDYVRTAQAKGLKGRTVLMRHAFRNAILPLVTLVGLSIPNLFGGAFIIENVFGWNGVGRLTVTSLQNNNYSVAMGAVMMLAILTVLGNLIADVLYAVLDPRVRYD